MLFQITNFYVDNYYFLETTTAGNPVSHNLNWATFAGLSGYIFHFCNGTWSGSFCLSTTNWLSGWTYRKQHNISQEISKIHSLIYCILFTAKIE
jgi:hypothetical protein